MPKLQVFELPQLAAILSLDLTKAKNWTNGRTKLVIEPSIQKAAGTGTRNLFSLEDLYLMGVAREFSKAGFAAQAIGRLIEAMRQEVASYDRNTVVTCWRVKLGGPFHLAKTRTKPDQRATLWHVFEIGELLKEIDESVNRSSKG